MNKITLRKLTVNDADALTQLYLQTEITKTNYKIKLSDSEQSFKNTGGMFLINDKKRNIEILSSENDVVIGGECDGVLCGMIWYNLHNTDYPFDKIKYIRGKLRYKDIIARELENKKLFAGKEIIVSPEAKGGLAYRLFYELLDKAYESGACYKTGEVYRVDGYEDETGFHGVRLLNLPSFHTLKRTGGIQIGYLNQKIIEKDGVRYYITPLVFIWEIESSLKALKETIQKKAGTLYEF